MKDRQVILIVDDQLSNIELLEAYLLPQGYVIVTATSGEEAVAKLGLNEVDLILLDVMMPELDGLDTLERLRSMPHLADTPALFVTGLTNASDIERYADAGAIGVIPKPLVPLRLTDQLRTLWEQHQLGHPNA